MHFYAFPAWSLSGSRTSLGIKSRYTAPNHEKDCSPGPMYDTSSNTNTAPTWK